MRKVSIIPRTMSLGVTISSPDAERTNYDVEYLIGRIQVALGGRIAEEVVYGTISAGAESDIQQLTGIARQMVGRWGMSQAIGPIAVIPSEGQGLLLPGVSEVSEATQELIDREVGGSSTRRTRSSRGCSPRTATSSTASPSAARRGDARHGRRVRGRRRACRVPRGARERAGSNA